MTGTSKAWLGGFGELGKPYTHPSTKQCNYSYTHPSTKQCNYTVDTSSFATITQLNELKTSVSNGKSAVASAITDKGISTSATASFDTMASNINSLKIKPTITYKTITFKTQSLGVTLYWTDENYTYQTLTIAKKTDYTGQYMSGTLLAMGFSSGGLNLLNVTGMTLITTWRSSTEDAGCRIYQIN